MSKIEELAEKGQSVWYDYIERDLITSGELDRWIEKGVRGITSNPSIFEKAISGGGGYDEEIQKLSGQGKETLEVYEALALRDIELAADCFLPLYRKSGGLDGYVSLEVNPHFAQETEKTVKEGERFFKALQRPNIMIKVPATAPGIPAIAQLIELGININATLIFSTESYRQVALAYIEGLEKRAVKGGDLESISSVASFFVSRIDTAVDKELEARGETALQGKIAIANGKAAHDIFLELFTGERWENLAARGANVQRLLWASTGTKNPAYPDTHYVDNLIGNQTVNTLPPATLEAFLDHGRVEEKLSWDKEEARNQLARLEELGVDLQAVTAKLQKDGVQAFTDAFEGLLGSIAKKGDL